MSCLINVAISGNFIGTDITGMLALENVTAISRQSSNVNIIIGGQSPADRNILVGDLASKGIISFSAPGVPDFPFEFAYNAIQGNILGLAKDGVTPIGINNKGITLLGSHCSIGGPLVSDRNVIANIIQNAIEVQGLAFAVYNTIQNNYIDTDVTGLLARAAGNNGIVVNAAATLIDSNLITNATNANILVTNTQTEFPRQVMITNNSIGTDAPGLASLSPLATGILFNPVQMIQTIDTLYGFFTISNNLISGNATGIAINTASNLVALSTGLISGNTIGADGSGNNPLPNLQAGIIVTNSDHITIGGTPELGNSIAFNGGPGILLAQAASYNTIAGNTITSNTNTGLTIAGQSFKNIIGGANTITGNGSFQILIHQQSNDNLTQGNTIAGSVPDIVIGDNALDLCINNAVLSNSISIQ